MRYSGGSPIVTIILGGIFLMIVTPLVMQTFHDAMVHAWPYIISAAIVFVGLWILSRFWGNSRRH